jgi:hypothetical protein
VSEQRFAVAVTAVLVLEADVGVGVGVGVGARTGVIPRFDAEVVEVLVLDTLRKLLALICAEKTDGSKPDDPLF